jgi:hypothetical protein
MPVLN